MLGAIAGDIIGSVYERHNIKATDFPLFDPRCHFTDDTVMTVAVADAILTGTDYGGKLREWYRLYPERGYGSDFRRWAASENTGQGYSMGNGSAMRVSPVGRVDDVLRFGVGEVTLWCLAAYDLPNVTTSAEETTSLFHR